MISFVKIQNFRSFLDAEVALQPMTLIVGANGSGKSNLLKFFAAISGNAGAVNYNGPALRMRRGKDGALFQLVEPQWHLHQNGNDRDAGFRVDVFDSTVEGDVLTPAGRPVVMSNSLLPWQGINLPIFNINPEQVSAVETAVPKPSVAASGAGTAQVLDSLKNGDREDLFDGIEENLRRYVPEVEKLSLQTVENGKKQIQVRERGLKTPVPATELSEGTRLILCILTILHQEKPPAVILLEDIDRGMHPRLFEYVAPLMQDIAERSQINILATTHNPYLVDCFQDRKDSVIIVEKKDGASTLTTLSKKLEGLDYNTVDPEDVPLGSLWYSGLIGGTPSKAISEPRR